MADHDRIHSPASSAPAAAGDWATLQELLLRCSNALRDELAARSQGVALSGAQFTLLWACETDIAGLSQRELALRLSLSAAHVSGLVEQLSARGLIVGQRAPQDRRRQIWRLTEQGRATVRQVFAELEPLARCLNVLLSAGVREQLARQLSELCEALQHASAVHAFSATRSAEVLGGAA